MKVENMEVVNSIVVLLMGVFVILMLGLTGCSFKVEMGYHGQSGRDDRTQTQLVNGKRVVTKDNY